MAELQKHLYLILHPNEALVASQLSPEAFGSHYSIGSPRHFTGKGWRKFLGFTDSPLFEDYAAGIKLAELAKRYDFSFFEYWASDYAGHKQDMDSAVRQLQTFDGVLQGLLDTWRDEDGLILLTSDHGNMEDLSTRRHTDADVPGLVIGNKSARDEFTQPVLREQFVEFTPAQRVSPDLHVHFFQHGPQPPIDSAAFG